MKNVIIPTDFSVRSLNLVRYAINHFSNEKLQIIMLHLMELPSGIDLYMLGRENKTSCLISSDFRNEVEAIRQAHANTITSIYSDFLYCGSQITFNNYLRSRSIDAIIYSDAFDLKFTKACSIHPRRFLKRCKVPVLSIKINQPVKEPVRSRERAFELA